MADIVLITMPWDVLASPSLALGTLQTLLENEGFDVDTRSFKLLWMDHLLAAQRPGRARITLADYEEVACSGGGLGDWVFAEPPMASWAKVGEYRARLRERGDETRLAKLTEMRRLAPGFLDACARDVLARRPRVVGFTTTFCQNMSSLALARRLKVADPALRIVFGGANCEGPMGAALQRCFPWIDVVVRGEGEAIVPQLFRDLLAGEPPRPAPGLCYFENGKQVVLPGAAATVAMDAVPPPTYDDYFADLDTCSFRDTLRATVFLSFESARGCWWGEVSHCTFCGLNGATMAFRSKPSQRVLDEILELARRYHVLDLHAVDNILDHGYFADLLPHIAETGLDLRLFYEVKSNLKKRQLHTLRRAGVRRIQPGIESLSTPILRLMKKGVTAWQNLRLLKWCAELGVEPEWNLIFGFPGEPEDEYRAMAELIPSLAHLRPPRIGPLGLHRFSPYHQRPAEHGLEIRGAAPHYALLYDVAAEALAEIAYEFDYRHRDGRAPERYARACVDAVARWEAAHRGGASLVYRRGPGFVHIRDARDPKATHIADYTLEGHEAEIYLACDDGARFPAVIERTGLAPALVVTVIDELVAQGLVYREGDHLLGLAVASRRGEDRSEERVEEADEDLVPSARLVVSARAAARC